MDESVVAAAGASDVVRQLREFTEWVGAGRKLTQTGRITMVDARMLVDRLGTGDRVNERIGTRVFKTRTSQELPGLCLVLEWALAARLVRRVHGRIVAVKKNRPLLDRPLELWQRALEVVPSIGAAICPPGWLESLILLEFRSVVPALLSRLYGGPASLADLDTLCWDTVTAPYRIEDVPPERSQLCASATTSTPGCCWTRCAP